ncbi:MAG: CinA family nicotinamide mononucleotide deamidase-related protein [Desulfatiglandaceae bacterium]
MNCEIITIGDELTSGKIPDVNSRYACGRLIAAGLRVTRIISLGDDQQTVSFEIEQAMRRGGFVIVTGGLGSTVDDITSEIAAVAFRRKLVRHSEVYRSLLRYVDETGTKLNRPLEKLAMLPEGAEPLDPYGNTCGFEIEVGDAVFFFLPGVPEQMRSLLDRSVIPRISRVCGPLERLFQRVLKLYGISESRVAEMLEDLQRSEPDVIFGFYPRFPEIHVTLSFRGAEEKQAHKILERVQNAACDLLGSFVFTVGDRTMAHVVGELLHRNGLSVALAESCTGGLIGHLLTNEAGSSEYFKGGCIVYSNEAKMDLLGVKPDTLHAYGAVSGPTAREMASGARERLRADIGIAVTGIAGPGGGSVEKPVGMVYLGLCSEKGLYSGLYRFRGTRGRIKTDSAMMALDWIRRYLNDDSFIPGL